MGKDKFLVFIVEDDELYSTMLDYTLTRESTHQFIRYNSGEDCLANIFHNPDVVILDYGLPGMDGLEALYNIKKYDAAIPVIILTGNRNLSVAKQLLDTGAFDYIDKADKDAASIIVATMNNALILSKQEKFQKKEKGKRIIKILCTLLVIILIILGIGIARINSVTLFQ